MSTDLHAQLDAAVRARLEVARAAADVHGAPHWGCQLTDTGWRACTPAEDGISVSGVEEVAEHVAANDPATVIRMCERDLRVLARHKVCKQVNHFHATGGACHQCSDLQPCPDIRDMAVAYGLLDPTAGE